MKLTIQSIHFTADQKLVDYVTQKTEKLGQFFDRITDGQVYLKLTKPATHHNKVVEIKLSVPGKVLIAEEKANTFEEATDAALSKLKTQVTRYKDKLKSHH